LAPCRIRRKVSVQVVAVARRCNSVFGLIVVDLEADCTALADIAKGIVTEVLTPGGATVGAGNSPQVIVGIVAGLAVYCSRNGIDDCELLEAAIGIPGQRTGIGLTVHVERILGQPPGVLIITERIRVILPAGARAQTNREQRPQWLVRR